MTPEKARKQIMRRSNQTFLGSRTSKLGVEEHIGVPDGYRYTHVLNLGPTGYGKSVLMGHAALQDAYKDHGLCLINVKGDLIDDFISKLPEKRWDDIIYINPATENVASINILEPYTNGRMTPAQKDNQKEIIVSDLIDLFKRRSENWGARFGRILETLLRAYLDLNIKNNESNSLIDVYRSVINSRELSKLIDRTQDTVVREQLIRVKEDLSSYELEPLQRRLNDFVMNPTIRRFIGADESGVDFRKAVNQGKIILVDAQKGELGDTVSEVVGSIVITKVWAAAQSRVTQPLEERRPFHLFVDELQNFTGEGSNFAKILSEAREYRLGCWLATQYLQQLSSKMRRSVTNNCQTLVCFNPSGSDDESRIAGMLQGIQKHDLKQLGKYRAAVQKPSEGNQRSAVFFTTYPPWNTDNDHVNQIKQRQTPTANPETGFSPSLGAGSNSGGEKHSELLKQAKNQLEDRGMQVTLLYQDTGDEKPDGHVHLPNDETAHLEAEHSTLSKPAKVLKNLERGQKQNREVIFVVEQGKAAKLTNIISDPVNRQGDKHQDQQGSFSYYTTEDGEPFTDLETIREAEYRIIELQEDELKEYEEGEAECPELRHNERKDLESFCLYRDEDGFCSELETRCVLQADD